MTKDGNLWGKTRAEIVLDCGKTRVALNGISDAYDRLIDDYRDLEWDYDLLKSNNEKLTNAYMELLMKTGKNKSIDV